MVRTSQTFDRYNKDRTNELFERMTRLAQNAPQRSEPRQPVPRAPAEPQR